MESLQPRVCRDLGKVSLHPLPGSQKTLLIPAPSAVPTIPNFHPQSRKGFFLFHLSRILLLFSGSLQVSAKKKLFPWWLPRWNMEKRSQKTDRKWGKYSEELIFSPGTPLSFHSLSRVLNQEFLHQQNERERLSQNPRISEVGKSL